MMDISLQWKSLCKSNRRALHLKLAQGCQLYLSGTGRVGGGGRRHIWPHWWILPVKEEGQLTQKIEEEESHLKLFYKASISFLSKLDKDIARKSHFSYHFKHSHYNF